MATVIICVTCKHPITFADPSPSVLRDWEREVECRACKTKYAILVRITQPAPVKLEEVVVNKPT